jgi:hypothetical protein
LELSRKEHFEQINLGRAQVQKGIKRTRHSPMVPVSSNCADFKSDLVATTWRVDFSQLIANKASNSRVLLRTASALFSDNRLKSRLSIWSHVSEQIIIQHAQRLDRLAVLKSAGER